MQAARWFANVDAAGGRQPALSLWCQGLNPSRNGTDKNITLLNLHLVTGQIGRPGWRRPRPVAALVDALAISAPPGVGLTGSMAR